MRTITTLVAATMFAATPPSAAKPTAPDHPIVGTWKITLPLPDGSCDEIYRMRADGTTFVTSAEEVSESEYEISDAPSEKGFYKLVDTITKDNGKKDCLGEVMQVGHAATNYILFHPSGDMFLMCREERLASCIGPFVRQKDGDA
jgi:hypothetical protein